MKKELYKLIFLIIGLTFLVHHSYAQCTPKISASRVPTSFKLVNGNFLSSLGSTIDNAAPTFADLDNDGLLEIIIGAANGNIYITEQVAANSYSFNNTLQIITWPFAITHTKPHIYDYDNDGLWDIFLGSASGLVYQLEQTAPNAISFSNPANAVFLGLDFGDFSAPFFSKGWTSGSTNTNLNVGKSDGTLVALREDPFSGYASAGTLTFSGETDIVPIFNDFNGDNIIDFIFGKGDGKLYHGIIPSYSTINSQTNSLTSIDVGDKSAPAMADIDGDGLMDLIIGNADGSLQHYEQDAGTFEAFKSILGTPSAGQSIQVWGQKCFTGSITVTAPAGFQVSLSRNSGFSNSVSIAQNSGVVTNDSVYVRFNPSVAGTYNGNLQITSPSATTKTFALTGDLFVPPTCSPSISVVKSPSLFQSVNTDYNNIAVGTYANPAVYDIDNDGLLDLLIGNLDGTLVHYEQNTSASHNFTLISTNFSNIDVGLFSRPFITDLDGDYLLDLIIGNYSGTSKLIHYEQDGLELLTFSVVAGSNINSIGVGTLTVPIVTDIDNDGLKDLLVGLDDGTLQRYEQAALNSQNFTFVASNFAGIDVGVNANPTPIDMDGDGLLDLVIGNLAGTFSHYEQASVSSTTFNLVTSNFLNINLGSNIAGSFFDIDKNGRLDFLVGIGGGKVEHYEQEVQLNTFSTILGNPSDAQSIQVWGKECFTGNIVVTAPSGFQVSLSRNSGFASSVSIVQSNGVVLNDSVYVRFNPSTAGTYNGSLQITSASATSRSIALVGELFVPPVCSPTFTVTKSPTALNLVSSNFNAIGVGATAAPAIADIDNDGLLDLLIGNTDGKLLHYEQNTVNSLVFTLISSSFNNIDIGAFSRPIITDLNNDYRLDLIIGEYGTNAKLEIYEQTSLGGYTFSKVSNSNIESIGTGTLTAPTITDIDNDGLKDMLVGLDDGTLYRYEQSSLNSSTFTLVTTNFAGIDVGLNAQPTSTDLDGDGLLDLVIGSSNGTYSHYEQASANGLVFGLVGNNFQNISVATNTTGIFYDLDKDGNLDFLVGIQDGKLAHYEQQPGNFMFTTVAGTPSALQNVQIWGGACLTGNITVSVPSDFQVSTSSTSGFTNSLTFTPTNGRLLATTFYVRYNPLVRGSSAGSMQVSSAGVSTATILLQGYTPAVCTPVVSAVKEPSVFNLVSTIFNGIDIGNNAAPAFVDLDYDGLLDLIIGKQDGTLSHYRQNSSNSFSFSIVNTGFSSIDAGANSRPTFTDLDGDNLLDMLVTNNSGGVIHYEQPTVGSHVFDLKNNNFNTIGAGTYTSIAVADIDNDGLKDIIAGYEDGTLKHYEQASANSLTFNLVSSNFNSITVTTNAQPSVIDLDGDRLLDLVVSNSAGIFYHYEQVSTNSLTFSLVNPNFGPISPGTDVSSIFYDVNNDGLLELYIGRALGSVVYTSQSLGNFANFTSNENTPSASQELPIWSNACLTADLIVSTSPGFQVSLSPTSGFASNLTITPVSGKLGISKVFVRMLSGIIGANTGTLQMNSVGVNPISFNLAGSITACQNNQQIIFSTNPSVFSSVATDFNAINVSSNAASTTTDLDGDGLVDLLVAGGSGQIKHYEQTTTNLPSFGLVSNNFGNISIINTNLKPCIADIDKDGLLDLIIGASTGVLYHYEQSGSGSLSFNTISNSFNSIDVGDNSSPAMIDLDGDDLLDLLIGNQAGKIVHYEQAAAQSLTFNLVTTDFNSITINGGSATPTLVDIEGDGMLDLMVGRLDGQLVHYKQSAAKSLVFSLISNQFSSIFSSFGNSHPTFADFDNDGYWDLLVGNSNGTMAHYEQSAGSLGEFNLDDLTVQSLSIWGKSCLTDNLVITAPANFEVSLSSNSNFSNSITLPNVSGKVANTTVFIRFNTTICNTYAGNLTMTAGGVSKSLILTGKSSYSAPVETSNNGLLFDGVDDYVAISPLNYTDCSSSIPAVSFTDGMTIEYWFKGTNLQSAVRLQNGGNYVVAGWKNAQGNYLHIVSSLTGTNGLEVGSAATDGNWHHIALTWQRSNRTLTSYLDGQVVQTRTVAGTTNVPNITAPYYIGSFNGTSEFMNGNIDEVRVWNIARSVQQLNESMCTELSTPLAGLVMYYKFNHGTDGSNNAGQRKLLNSANSNLFTASLKNFTLEGSASNWVTGATCIVTLSSISSPVLTKTSFCAGTTFNLTFTSSGNFGGGNTFQAILSDKNGAFTTGQVIGTASTSGSISCTVPSNIAFGENYLIRVKSTSPVINGSANAGVLTLHAKDRTLVSPSDDSSSGNLTIKATDTITATNANSGTVNATYQAGKSVLLLPGFKVNNTSVFKAEIKACE